MSTISESFYSLIDKIKLWWADFNLQTLSEKIGGSSAEAIQAAIYFGVAFVSGFLFKKYAKFLLILLVVIVASIKILEYNDLITLHWETFHSVTGIATPLDYNALMKSSFAWVKQNILLTVAAALGFLVGYKLA